MIKSVLVTLGIDVGKFTSGLNQARSGFDAFTGGIGGGINSAITFLGHLGQAVELVQNAFNGLVNAAKFLFDQFISGVAAEQRLTTQLGVLMGGLSKAKDFISGVADANQRLGFVTDDMIPAINQGATALKALDGAVDPGKLEQFVDLVRRIKAARPDLDFGTISTTLLRGMRGDLESMKRTLGIGIDDIVGLSDKAKATMAAMQTTSDTQLGQVTKVGAGVKAKTEDVLSLLDEALGKIGMGQSAVTEYGKTWDAQVARLQEVWDNFKDTVGEPILEVLIEELKKLGDWLGSHKEEVKEFAEKLGHFTAEGLKNALEALMKVDWDKALKATEGMMAAFAKIDWAAVAKTFDDIGKLMGTPAGNPELAGEAAAKDLKKSLGMAPDQSLADTKAGQDIFKWLNQAAQKIEVTIGIDNDANLKAVVKQHATQAVNDVVEQATKTSGGNSDYARGKPNG